MRILSKFFFLIVLTVGSAGSGLAAIFNVPCNYLSISNALATANEGDIVFIQPGSCTISNEIIIDRHTSFTIRGAGTNQTTLISSGIGGNSIWVRSDSANVFTISDLNCVGHANDLYGFIISGNNPPCPQMAGPVHYYNIQMTNVLHRGISLGGGGSFGLVDHCYMKSQPGNPQFMDFQGNEYRSWTNAGNPLGTTNVCCVEDCYFDNGTNNGNGFFDSYNGSQIVWRHNYCTGNAPSGVHGYDSGQTSARTWEIYDNIFTNQANVLGVELRGGTGVVFSNQFYGAVDVCELCCYRSCPSNHIGTANSYGLPGQGYDVNFSGTPTGGWQKYFTGNPLNNSTLALGQTTYTFVSSYADGGANYYGGGNVVIGATVAETIANLYNCINLGPGAGTTYAASAKIGHDFIAIGLTATDLILTNALDGNTDSFGYPANQQIGVLCSYPLTGTNFVNNQVLLPAYAWGNRLNGVSHDFTLKDDQSICSFNIVNLVMLSRDYFIGSPAPSYTPLVYPHPLQALEVGTLSSTNAPPGLLKAGPPP